MYTDILRGLRDAVRRKRSQKWRTESWFLLHVNAPAYPSVLAKDFLTKNNVTTLEHLPILSWSGYNWVLPVPSTKIRIEGAFVVLLTKNVAEELKKLSQNGFQSLEEVYSCTRGLFWSKCSLSDFTVLCFSQIKWFREHLEATTYDGNAIKVNEENFMFWQNNDIVVKQRYVVSMQSSYL